MIARGGDRDRVEMAVRDGSTDTVESEMRAEESFERCGVEERARAAAAEHAAER